MNASITVRDIDDNIVQAIQLAAKSAGLSREALLRRYFEREFGPRTSATSGISFRFRKLVDEALSLGQGNMLQPAPSVADIARVFGHPNTASLDAALRGYIPLSFSDADRFCDMFGCNRRWLETGELRPYSQRPKYHDATEMFRDFYRTAVPYKRLYFVLCKDDRGTAAVYGQDTDYRYELLLDEIPIHDDVGSGGRRDLTEFCLFLASIAALAHFSGSQPLLFRGSIGKASPGLSGRVLGAVDFEHLVSGRSHPASMLQERNVASSPWFDDLCDLEYTSTYSENYDRAKTLWRAHMAGQNTTTNEALMNTVRARLKTWQLTDDELASLLRDHDPERDVHSYEHYSAIVSLAHNRSASAERAQLFALFDKMPGQPMPDWLDPYGV